MNIRNVTSLRAAAKASGIKLPGKPVTNAIFPIAPTSGYFITENPLGQYAAVFYQPTYELIQRKHPLNKSRVTTGTRVKGMTLSGNIVWQDAPLSVISAQVLGMVALH